MSTVNDLDVSYCDCSAACERVCCNHCGSELGVIPRHNDGASPLLATEFTERPNRPKDKLMDTAGILKFDDVEGAAYLWWLSKRPAPCTEKWHIANATVNCATQEEKRLAVCVAGALS